MPAEKLDIGGYDAVYRLPLSAGTGLLAIHRTFGGAAFGGIRVRTYPSEGPALHDSLALAKAMSRKVVLSGARGGGAKMVVNLRHDCTPQERRDAMQEIGEFIESLGGSYHCGGDMGFTDEDDQIIRGATQYVSCSGLGSSTAESVWNCIEKAGGAQRVAIQGVGSIGATLAARATQAGAAVWATDLKLDMEPPMVEWVASPEDIYTQPCDVFSPCAVGGVLNETTIPMLACSVVCGGANNQLATSEDAQRLLERNIVYVPDFIANAGATVLGVSNALGESDKVKARMEALGNLCADVLERASAQKRSPNDIAVALSDERIARLDREG